MENNMFKMYGDYKFKLEKDYYENDKNGNYFTVSKFVNDKIYQIIFYNKNGVVLLEKNIEIEDNEIEKEIIKIVNEIESII